MEHKFRIKLNFASIISPTQSCVRKFFDGDPGVFLDTMDIHVTFGSNAVESENVTTYTWLEQFWN